MMRRVLRRIPQPYKTWVARAVLPLTFIIIIPFAALYALYDFARDCVEEFDDSWKVCSRW